MKQLEIILNRLKKPRVLLSIASQIITILVLLNIKVDENAIMGIVTSACAILALLGIVSDPDSESSGYGDDILTCSQCGETCKHVSINGKMICSQCGMEYKDPNQIESPKTEDTEGSK